MFGKRNQLIQASQMEFQLDKMLFMNILQYEEQLLNGYFQCEIIEQLIPLYAQCVEYYNLLKDPIQYYFLEKMQILISHEPALKEISKKSAKQMKSMRKQSMLKEQQENGKTSTSDINSILDSDDDCEYLLQNIKQDSEEPKLSMQQARTKYKLQSQSRAGAKYSISKKRIERAKRVEIYMQVQLDKDIKRSNTTDVQSMFQNCADNSAKQSDSVKQTLDSQQQLLERRLHRRKTIKEGKTKIGKSREFAHGISRDSISKLGRNSHGKSNKNSLVKSNKESSGKLQRDSIGKQNRNSTNNKSLDFVIRKLSSDLKIRKESLEINEKKQIQDISGWLDEDEDDGQAIQSEEAGNQAEQRVSFKEEENEVNILSGIDSMVEKHGIN